MSIEVHVQTVSPEMADKILSECEYVHQRKPRPHLITRYTNDMKNFRWNPGSVIEFAEAQGQTYLINGQHRLKAIIEAKTAQDFVFKTEHLTSAEEIARRYYTIDTGGGRTFSEVIKAGELAENLGLATYEIKATKAAALLIYRGFQRASGNYRLFSPDEQSMLAQYWSKEATRYFKAIAPAPEEIKKRLRASPALAVGLVTLHWQCEDALRFWKKVAEDNGLYQGDPAKALLDLLHSSHSIQKTGAEIFARKVAAAWNAFFENREIQMRNLIVRSADSNINIVGTPFLYSRSLTGTGLPKETRES